jgi:4-hydroxybenzoate polyprenyltransferase
LIAALKLIRWQNLLIILLTQFLAWWFVILPEHATNPGTLFLLDTTNFIFLCASTVLIAASGYIINDYFDVRIDNINHPEKVILGRSIPRKTAIIWHALLNVIAIALAARIAVRAHHYEWLLIQLTCIVLLWFYSTSFKRQYIIGNVVVSLLTAFTILVLIVYEPAMHRALHINIFDRSAEGRASAFPVWVLAVYSWFAFMLTWMREIVKDMEDLIGDEAEGCVTMPIKLGLRGATRFTILLGILVLVPLLLGFTALWVKQYQLLAMYVLLFLALPVVVWLWLLPRGIDTTHYAKASRGLKIIMVLGICSLFVYHFQLRV